ncbi:MAG: phosphoglucomutase/phosphomannomutase family protein, partial [Elusimicrobia bacterium]|nr:phosphoglucomutase/phosphomannomutase family protein [Elusimicrobiota bacterium]
GLKQKIVIDYMHGSGARILEDILKSKNIVSINANHDPMFGGIAPEPVLANLKELIERVKREKAAIGMAFDGDADRIAVIDEKGNYFTPCQLFPIILDYLISARKMSGKIVQSVSMGYLSKRIAKERGYEFEETPVGFKNIAEKMVLEDVLAGGEESGGYAWKGNIAERDCTATALLLMEIIAKTGKKPSELLADIEKRYGKSHFIRKDFALVKAAPEKAGFAERIKKKLPKKICKKSVAEAKTIDGLKVILEDDSWFLMRPSGTEPLIRIYAESSSERTTQDLLAFAEKLPMLKK